MLSFFRWLLSCFEYGVYVYLLVYTCPIILILCFADVFRLEFGSALDACSFFVALLFGICPPILFTTVILVYEIRILKTKTKRKEFDSRKGLFRKLYYNLTASFKEKFICKIYYVQYLLKRFLVALFLIAVKAGAVQIAVFIVLCVASTVYSVVTRPYK